MECGEIIGRQLRTVWTAPHKPQPAWAAPDTPEIQVYFVDLEFADDFVIHIVADEVEVPGCYPSLGIQVRKVLDPSEKGRWYEGTALRATYLEQLVPFLPAEVVETRLWDSMGEGPDSAFDLVLSNGTVLRVRHIFPPMILGVEIFASKEKAGA